MQQKNDRFQKNHSEKNKVDIKRWSADPVVAKQEDEESEKVCKCFNTFYIH